MPLGGGFKEDSTNKTQTALVLFTTCAPKTVLFRLVNEEVRNRSLITIKRIHMPAFNLKFHDAAEQN